jgi:hypothetical protein
MIRPPWRDPKESPRALEQRARNDGARPRCKNCDLPLVPFVQYDWPIRELHPRERWIDGYGNRGRGLFCTSRCAITLAYYMFRKQEVGR